MGQYDTRFLLLGLIAFLKSYFEEPPTAAGPTSTTTATYKFLLIAVVAIIFSLLFLVTSLKLRLCKTCSCSSPSGSGSVTRHQTNIHADLLFGGSELSLPLAASFITLLLLPSKVLLWVYPLIILMSLCSQSLHTFLTASSYTLISFHVHLHTAPPPPPNNYSLLLPLSSSIAAAASTTDDTESDHVIVDIVPPTVDLPASTDHDQINPNPVVHERSAGGLPVNLSDDVTTDHDPVQPHDMQRQGALTSSSTILGYYSPTIIAEARGNLLSIHGVPSSSSTSSSSDSMYINNDQVSLVMVINSSSSIILHRLLTTDYPNLIPNPLMIISVPDGSAPVSFLITPAHNVSIRGAGEIASVDVVAASL